MEKLNFFSHEAFSDRLILFNEGYSMVHRFVLGCVVGDEKILLIDAGLGMTGELRAYVERVVGTDKPILCACTHNHPDNVGSACQFDEAYCSHLDTPALDDVSFSDQERLRRMWVYGLESKIAMEYARENMIHHNRTVFRDIVDGQIFDLGGVQIQAIAVPGHTKGSMAFWNREEKYVFTGDAVNTDVHMEHASRQDLLDYADTVERMIAIVGENVTLYPAHLPLEMDISVAKNVAAACREIAAGNTYGDPPGETIFLEEQNDPNMRMHFVHNTCVVYDRSKVSPAAD